MRIILASQSPRRKELLSLYGFPFEVIPSNADESGITGSCGHIVVELARIKGQEVARRNPEAVVIASDTLVCLGNEILGKPKDEADAERMLKQLSGNTHEVHTGLYLCTPDGSEWMDEDVARVRFAPLPYSWIRSYIASGEPMDKAGAYAIQGHAGIFIESLEGSPFTVVGLPLSLLTRFLTQAGVPYFPGR